MTDADLAGAFWERARTALTVAEHVLGISPREAASRAYYAAFYAVSALFALRGCTFKRHSAVESAVHRDLVKTGQWAESLGEEYSRLARLRNISDYAVMESILEKDAQRSLAAASDILQAVARSYPENFGVKT